MTRGGTGGASASGGSGGVPLAGQGGSSGDNSAGDAGAPSEPVADGLVCERQACVPGEVCVNCDYFGDALPLICTPDPEDDPEGYQARVDQAGCLAVYLEFECDGPEDCASGESCVTSPDLKYGAGSCVAAPPCEAPYACVVCRSDDDCPTPFACGEEQRSVLGIRRYCAE